MRKKQLTIHLESFGDCSTNGSRNKICGYVDGNDIYEVLQETLKELHKVYKPNISFTEFCDNVKNAEYVRFGRTEINNYEE